MADQTVPRQQAIEALEKLGVRVGNRKRVVVQVDMVDDRAFVKSLEEWPSPRYGDGAANAVSEPRFLTTGKAADLLGVSRETVRRWCAKGWLPSVRVGGRRHVPFEALKPGLELRSRLEAFTGGRVISTEFDGDMRDD